MRTSAGPTVLGIAVALFVVGCGSKQEGSPGGAGGGEETGGAGGGGGGGGSGGRGGGGGTGGIGGSGGGGGAAAADAAAPADSAPGTDTATGGSEDVAAPVEAGPARVLFYTKTNGTTHVQGIATAVATLKSLLGPRGIASDTANDPMVFTESNLARYTGVVLVSTSGKPFGDPGTAQMEALVGFVKRGGGLAGFHAASSTEYGATSAYNTLLGGETKDQGGGFRTADCFPEPGSHPAVAKVSTPFRVTNEEFYTFNGLSPSNQVVLRCNPATGTEKIPISWVREVEAGRVFYTGIGHYPQIWGAGERFVLDHALPGILWAIGR